MTFVYLRPAQPPPACVNRTMAASVVGPRSMSVLMAAISRPYCCMRRSKTAVFRADQRSRRTDPLGNVRHVERVSVYRVVEMLTTIFLYAKPVNSTIAVLLHFSTHHISTSGVSIRRLTLCNPRRRTFSAPCVWAYDATLMLPHSFDEIPA